MRGGDAALSLDAHARAHVSPTQRAPPPPRRPRQPPSEGGGGGGERRTRQGVDEDGLPRRAEAPRGPATRRGITLYISTRGNTAKRAKITRRETQNGTGKNNKAKRAKTIQRKMWSISRLDKQGASEGGREAWRGGRRWAAGHPPRHSPPQRQARADAASPAGRRDERARRAANSR